MSTQGTEDHIVPFPENLSMRSAQRTGIANCKIVLLPWGAKAAVSTSKATTEWMVKWTENKEDLLSYFVLHHGPRQQTAKGP